jgi:hypothetical protein
VIKADAVVVGYRGKRQRLIQHPLGLVKLFADFPVGPPREGVPRRDLRARRQIEPGLQQSDFDAMSFAGRIT